MQNALFAGCENSSFRDAKMLVLGGVKRRVMHLWVSLTQVVKFRLILSVYVRLIYGFILLMCGVFLF